MSYVKKVSVLLVLVLALCGCGEGKTQSEVLLYTKDAKENKQSKIQTTKVVKKDYEETTTEKGSLYYTDLVEITMNVSNATLDSIKVKKGQKVNKGDVIATFSVEMDEAELARTKLELQSRRSEFNAGLKQRRNTISQAEKLYKSMGNSAEKKMKKIEIKKMKNELKQYLTSEADLKNSEENYQTELKDSKTTKLVSKESGIVTKVATDVDTGDPLEVGKSVCTLRKANKFMLVSEDTDGGMRYNMPVKVLIGGDRNTIKHSFSGRVMSAGNITGAETSLETSDTSDGETKNVVFIRISEANKRKYNFEENNIYVKYQKRYIKDALVVSNSAISSETEGEDTKNFVKVVEKGKEHKRYVVVLCTSGQESVIEQGVEAGQLLKISSDEE